MSLLINLGIVALTFLGMEGVAWFTHKFLMHGPLWMLHRDHHRRDDGQILERNDSFFVIFATPAIVLFLFGLQGGWNDYRIWIAVGITLYGAAYFLVHDVFIHQRFKFLRNSQHPYFKAIRRAHKVHHKQLGKEGGSCFGMLLVPYKYLKDSK